MTIARASLEVLVEENMVENSQEVGSYMKKKLESIHSPLIKEVRGRGLMNALEVRSDLNINGHDLCDVLRTHGVLTKATKDYSLRFTPALVINKKEVDEVVEILE